MAIVDLDDDQIFDRPAVVKQAGSRAKDFTAEFDNELVVNLFVAPALVKFVVSGAPAYLGSGARWCSRLPRLRRLRLLPADYRLHSHLRCLPRSPVSQCRWQ